MNAERTENSPVTGLLLVNLGTPDKPERRAVARFLRAFLSDPRVVDLPRWLWLPLLNLVIIPLRAARSAAAYRSIWWDEGSPLLVLTRRLARKLDGSIPGVGAVEIAMRYGNPSIQSALLRLQAAGAQRMIVLPLFPQFSYTTTASIFDAVDAAMQQLPGKPASMRINDYHLHPAWIGAVSACIRDFRRQNGVAEKLVFSLHGIPRRYVSNGDPYEEQCRASVQAIAHAAGLLEHEWLLAFQSRVGREPWLQPYTDKVLLELAEQGVRSVQVICPGFAVDCLETLEEIAIRNREQFIEAGGERLDYISALNDTDQHAAVMRALVADADAPSP